MKTKYLFTSERLGFRSWTPHDKPQLAQITANPEVMRYFPTPLDQAQTDKMVDGLIDHFEFYGYCYFAVESLLKGDLLGFIGLKYVELDLGSGFFTDIGWRLKRKAWGKGYATEGATRCLAYGFETLGLNKVYAMAPQANLPSIAVMERIGMKKVKDFVHPKLMSNEKLRDCVLYSIEAPEDPPLL